MTMQIFLKLDGVEGESADAHHRGEIELLGWTWGASAPTDGGEGVAKDGLPYARLVLKKHVDLASPVLMQWGAEARHIPSGLLTTRRATGGEFLVVRMTDVRVISIAAMVVADDNQAMETLTLGFGKIEIEYRPALPNGSLGEFRAFHWDFVANASF